MIPKPEAKAFGLALDAPERLKQDKAACKKYKRVAVNLRRHERRQAEWRLQLFLHADTLQRL